MKLLTLFGAMAMASSGHGSEYLVRLAPGFDASSPLLKNATITHLSFATIAKIDLQPAEVKAMKAQKSIQSVEANVRYHTWDNGITPTDNLFAQQWGLLNTGKNSGWFIFPGKKGEDINAVTAWQKETGHKGVKVAVIDTGIDYTHPDLAANIYVNEVEKNGVTGVDDDNNGYVDDIHGYDFVNKDGDPMDDQGHGTHCAGVIGALHNGAGTVGVMKDVTIVALKFLNAKGSGTLEDAVKAIDYAIKADVQVMSNSWGGGPRTELLEEAIKAADEKGIVFVAAAGNANSDNDKVASYPASYDIGNVISVGAMNGKGQSASFSNFGKKTVHVYAPGENILSTVPGNRYEKMSGTSMATPQVAGIAGLYLSAHPDATPEEVRAKFIGSSVKTTALSARSVSGGRLDASKVLE